MGEEPRQGIRNGLDAVQPRVPHGRLGVFYPAAIKTGDARRDFGRSGSGYNRLVQSGCESEPAAEIWPKFFSKLNELLLDQLIRSCLGRFRGTVVEERLPQ